MDDRSKKKVSKHTIFVVGFIAMLIAASFGYVYYVLFPKGCVWTNDAYIEAYGTDLSANVTEKIIALYFDEGDFVKEGELIAELQNNVPLANKAASIARIKSLEQEVEVKEAYFKKVRNDYGRASLGFQDKIISEQDYDHAEKNLDMANADLNLSKANLDLAIKELDVIEAKLVHYMILAPQNGVIAKRWVWLGDVTTPGQSLFTMYDLENVWVTANLEEYKMENIKLGDPVEISIDAYPGYAFHGKIFTIKGATASQFSLIPQNNATGNYTKVAQRIPIKISIEKPKNFPDDKELYLFPGMSCEVLIRL